MRNGTLQSYAIAARLCGGVLTLALMFFNPESSLSDTAEKEGFNLSTNHCSRCHIVEPGKPFSGISSTPSFSLLVNGIKDWEDRFYSFYALRPHPAFTRIEGFDNLLAKNPTTMPMELKLEDVEKIVSYVRTLKKTP